MGFLMRPRPGFTPASQSTTARPLDQATAKLDPSEPMATAFQLGDFEIPMIIPVALRSKQKRVVLSFPQQLRYGRRCCLTLDER